MKYLSLSAFLFIASFNLFALENGSYVNESYTQADPLMYKSVVLDSSACEKGGVVAKFNNADAMNFCVGHAKKDVFKYKKCFGKEVGGYPMGKICLGVKREVEMVTTAEVIFDEEKNAVVRFERHTDEGKVYFEQEYQLIDGGNGQLNVEHSFNSLHDGRTGSSEFNFQKNKI